METDTNNHIDDPESWDLIIDAKKDFKSIGFTALTKYKDLLFLLAKRDLATVYKQTFFGPFWLLFQPMIKVAVFYFVFGRLAGISTDGVPAILFYLIGLTFWEFFASIVRKSSKSFSANQHIFSKVYFPRLIVPLSTVVSAAIRSGIQAILLIAVYVFYLFTGEVQPTLWLLFLPLLVLLLALLGLGFGLLLAAATVVYRDIRFVIDTGLQILFYLTPVIYPLKMASGSAEKLLSINPLTPIMETLKMGFVGKGIFDVKFLIYSIFVSVALFYFGLRAFRQKERTFIDTI